MIGRNCLCFLLGDIYSETSIIIKRVDWEKLLSNSLILDERYSRLKGLVLKSLLTWFVARSWKIIILDPWFCRWNWTGLWRSLGKNYLQIKIWLRWTDSSYDRILTSYFHFYLTSYLSSFAVMQKRNKKIKSAPQYCGGAPTTLRQSLYNKRNATLELFLTSITVTYDR